MCGIVGSVSRSRRENFGQAVNAMQHRGPDASVIEQHDVDGWAISLGHRRLSIVDLSNAANQPFTSTCGNFTLIFNGEIYNHTELRVALVAQGYRFRTRSDTEVLLAGLMQEGVSFLSKANGMFALALLDKPRRRLTLARDPFGIKPLYLHRHDDGGIAFASELKSLSLAADLSLQPDRAYLSEFLLNGFLYEPASGFLNVEKVPPGAALELDLARQAFTAHRFHNPLARRSIEGDLGSRLTHQMGLEIEADVPVGVFFSGGIDSSVLVAAAPRKVEAFFVDYGDQQSGDSYYAEAVAGALGVTLRTVEHRLESASADDIITEFRQVARGTEEPISDYTYVATRAISRLARESGYKVMLSGMGGDELMAGYPRHAAASRWPKLRWAGRGLGFGADILAKFPSWEKRAGRLKAFLAADDFAEAYTALVGYFTAEEVSRMTGLEHGHALALDRIRSLLTPVQGQSALRQAMFLDRYGFLAHNLTVTDRASMAESIEVRVPLLNPDLEAFVLDLPDSALIRGRSGKLPLKSFLKHRLPNRLINRPKVGFNPPLDGRITKIGRERCTEILTSGKISGIIDPTVIGPWISEHFDGRANHSYRLWQLIYLSLWLDEWS